MLINTHYKLSEDRNREAKYILALGGSVIVLFGAGIVLRYANSLYHCRTLLAQNVI